MKSAFDCFQHAAKCEQMASAARDDASLAVLLSTADHWRALGKAAKIRELRAENYVPRPRLDLPSESQSRKKSSSPQ
jgi:hypothetical protein